MPGFSLQTEYLSFDQAKPLPIVTKLREFNSQVDEVCVSILYPLLLNVNMFSMHSFVNKL